MIMPSTPHQRGNHIPTQPGGEAAWSGPTTCAPYTPCHWQVPIVRCHPGMEVGNIDVSGLPQALGEASDSSYALLRYPITGPAGRTTLSCDGYVL
jgi:hypothetical protein